MASAASAISTASSATSPSTSSSGGGWRRGRTRPNRRTGRSLRAQASPEQHALHREELRLVARALDTLPAEQRTALEMYRLGGATLEEIAARLGISVATAHRHVRAAMARLAEELDRAGG